MDFDNNARLDTSRVSDRRGARIGGRTGSSPGGGVVIGSGVAGLLIAVLLAVLGINGTIPFPVDGSGGEAGNGSELATECSVQRPDRFHRDDCRNVAIFNDLQSYWSRAGAQRLGIAYRDPRFVLFSDAVTTGCGQASSAVGPFYCPADEQIFIDLSFYAELRDRFGATGEFAQAYVVAHEFGHHMQTLTGASARAEAARGQGQRAAGQASVALELQADCYAGVWARNAGDGPVGTTDEQDLREALDAASAIGDDRIQQRSGAEVDPDTWTHGSSRQRYDAFFTGHQTGDPLRC